MDTTAWKGILSSHRTSRRALASLAEGIGTTLAAPEEEDVDWRDLSNHLLASAARESENPSADAMLLGIARLVDAFASTHAEKAALHEERRQVERLQDGDRDWLLALASGPKSKSKLAAQFGVARSTAGRRVEKLERRGLVEQFQNPDNRRADVVRLAMLGEEVLELSQRPDPLRAFRQSIRHRLREFVSHPPRTRPRPGDLTRYYLHAAGVIAGWSLLEKPADDWTDDDYLYADLLTWFPLDSAVDQRDLSVLRVHQSEWSSRDDPRRHVIAAVFEYQIRGSRLELAAELENCAARLANDTAPELWALWAITSYGVAAERLAECSPDDERALALLQRVETESKRLVNSDALTGRGLAAGGVRSLLAYTGELATYYVAGRERVDWTGVCKVVASWKPDDAEPLKRTQQNLLVGADFRRHCQELDAALGRWSEHFLADRLQSTLSTRQEPRFASELNRWLETEGKARSEFAGLVAAVKDGGSPRRGRSAEERGVLKSVRDAAAELQAYIDRAVTTDPEADAAEVPPDFLHNLAFRDVLARQLIGDPESLNDALKRVASISATMTSTEVAVNQYPGVLVALHASISGQGGRPLASSPDEDRERDEAFATGAAAAYWIGKAPEPKQRPRVAISFG